MALEQNIGSVSSLVKNSEACQSYSQLFRIFNFKHDLFEIIFFQIFDKYKEKTIRSMDLF